MYVCMSVTLLQIDSSSLFLDGIEPFLGHQFSMTKTTKLFLRFFDLGPLMPKNLLPKICTKLPITRLVWQIDRRYLDLPWGFLGWPIQWNHAKCCGADPSCHGNDIWARRRRRDLVACRLVFFIVANEIILYLINKHFTNRKNAGCNMCMNYI